MDSNEPNGAKLFAKMARIMGKIKRLPKSGHNKHFDYKFATESDIADTIRELMAEENIALFAEMVAVDQTGKKSRAQYVFTFACGDTGYTRSCSWFGEADDAQDKGISKSATSAEKFFLLKTFVMSTGDECDDPDADAHLNKQAQPQKGTTSQSTTSGVTKAFPTQDAAKKWSLSWADKDVSSEFLLAALKVNKLSEYTGTLVEANNTVNNALRDRAVPFGKAG